jgi:hypothetical protein
MYGKDVVVGHNQHQSTSASIPYCVICCHACSIVDNTHLYYEQWIHAAIIVILLLWVLLLYSFVRWFLQCMYPDAGLFRIAYPPTLPSGGASDWACAVSSDCRQMIVTWGLPATNFHVTQEQTL